MGRRTCVRVLCLPTNVDHVRGRKVQLLTDIGDRFAVIPRGHHGYPQPEDGYRSLVWRPICPNCGWHGEQVSPFEVRRGFGAAHSAFIQLNWVFDAWFVKAEVADALMTSGLTGFRPETVLDSKSRMPVESHRQLHIDVAMPCMDVSRLQAVTCRPNNEESTLPMPAGSRKPDQGDWCGRVKHHPPTTVGLYRDLRNEPDLLFADEWVGSGFNAFRVILASRRFVDFVRKQGWRGLAFRPAISGMPSERAGE